MFTIIGADGKEYGPVSAARIAEWIAGGRANLATQARRVGEEEWKTLGDFLEFNPAALPPPIPAAPPVQILEATPSVAASDEPELADRGIRLGAFLIDYLLSVIVTVPGFILLGPTFLNILLAIMKGQEPDFSVLQAGTLITGLAVLALGSLALLIVQIVMLSTRGQTIGKRLLKIRVVRVPDGGQPGFVHGWLLRNLVPGVIQMLPWIGFAFYLADACFIFSQERRCLHDLIAGTKVVKA